MGWLCGRQTLSRHDHVVIHGYICRRRYTHTLGDSEPARRGCTWETRKLIMIPKTFGRELGPDKSSTIGYNKCLLTITPRVLQDSRFHWVERRPAVPVYVYPRRQQPTPRDGKSRTRYKQSRYFDNCNDVKQDNEALEVPDTGLPFPWFQSNVKSSSSSRLARVLIIARSHRLSSQTGEKCCSVECVMHQWRSLPMPVARGSRGDGF